MAGTLGAGVVAVTKGLDIAFFGCSLVSAYQNGPATYCRGILRALAERGHRIRFYEPLLDERLAHRDIVDPPWATVVRYAPDGSGLEEALADAYDADVLVKSSDIGLFDDLIEAALPQCTAASAISVYWDMSGPATLARLRERNDDALRLQLPWYDLVLIRNGGPETVEGFERMGARCCFPVYNAFDPTTHYPMAPEPHYSAVLTLCAHRAPERDEHVTRTFVSVAASHPGRRFVLAGCGWDDMSLPSNVSYLGYVYTGEHNALYSSTRALLNVPRPLAREAGFCPSARLFEAAGAGTCAISDAWPGVDQYFDPGNEILLADQGEDVAAHLAVLNPERAALIGRRARDRALTQHTFAHRAIDVEALLEGRDRQPRMAL